MIGAIACTLPACGDSDGPAVQATQLLFPEPAGPDAGIVEATSAVSPRSISGEAQPDTVARIECPPRKARYHDLVLLTHRLSLRKQNELAKMLKEDKANVKFMKKNKTVFHSQIHLTMKAKRFGRLFRGEMGYRFESLPDPPFGHCQPVIETYWIPLEYREYVHAVTTPDRHGNPLKASRWVPSGQ